MDRIAITPTEPLLPPEINRDYLGLINEALLRRHLRHVRYWSASHDEEKYYTLHPIGLVQREQQFSLFTVKDEIAN